MEYPLRNALISWAVMEPPIFRSASKRPAVTRRQTTALMKPPLDWPGDRPGRRWPVLNRQSTPMMYSIQPGVVAHSGSRKVNEIHNDQFPD